MAEFEDRATELAARFAKMDATLPTADAERVKAALKRHADLRAGCLTLICDVAEDKGDDKKMETLASRVDAAATDVLAVLNGMLDGIDKPGDNLRAFRDIAASEESKFFDALKKLNAGRTRDELMRFSHDLEWFTLTLRAKWQNLSETETELLKRERLYAAKMRETMKKVYEEAVPDYLTALRDGVALLATIEKAKSDLNEQIKANIKYEADKVGKDSTKAQSIVDYVRPGTLAAKALYYGLSLLSPVVAAVVKGVGKAAKNLEPFIQNDIDQHVEGIKSSLNCARTVIVTFSDTRRQAAEYVAKNGYSVAKQYLENSQRELSDFVSAMPTSSPALKTEAELVVTYARSAWLFFIETMRIHHGDFVKEFAGIFVDSVSDQTITTMTDKPYLTEFANGISSMDIDQKLNQIYADLVQLNGNLEKAFGSLTNFNDLPYEAQSILQEQVREFESNVSKPFTRSMEVELVKLEAARGKRPKAISEHLASVVTDMVQDMMRVTGAPSSG